MAMGFEYEARRAVRDFKQVDSTKVDMFKESKSGRSQDSQAVRRRASSEPWPLQVHLEPWVLDVQFRQRGLPILHLHGWEVFFRSSSSSQVAVVRRSVFVD